MDSTSTKASIILAIIIVSVLLSALMWYMVYLYQLLRSTTASKAETPAASKDSFDMENNWNPGHFSEHSQHHIDSHTAVHEPNKDGQHDHKEDSREWTVISVF